MAVHLILHMMTRRGVDSDTLYVFDIVLLLTINYTFYLHRGREVEDKNQVLTANILS